MYYQNEADFSKEVLFDRIKKQFDQEMRKILAIKEYYTSQELFFAFHIGYISNWRENCCSF